MKKLVACVMLLFATGCGTICDGHVRNFCIITQTSEPIWPYLPEYIYEMQYLVGLDCKNLKGKDVEIELVIEPSWSLLEYKDQYIYNGLTYASSNRMRVRYRPLLSDTSLSHEFFLHWVPYNCDLDGDGEADHNSNVEHSDEIAKRFETKRRILTTSFEDEH